MPDGRFRVSLRSKGGLDVSTIAQEFGGGGHTCASGCAVDGPLHAAVESVLARIRKGSGQWPVVSGQ
jgi:phosphoesterase RecJ-like protein